MRLTKDGKHNTNTTLDALCIQLLLERQNNLCLCGISLLKGYQITHKRYGIDITLNDLALKCGLCHAKEHGLKSFTGRLRIK